MSKDIEISADIHIKIAGQKLVLQFDELIELKNRIEEVLAIAREPATTTTWSNNPQPYYVTPTTYTTVAGTNLATGNITFDTISESFGEISSLASSSTS